MIRHSQAFKPRHRGVAAVEFAVCLPVMTLVAVAALQVGYGILLRQQALYVAETTAIEYSLGNIQEQQLVPRANQAARNLGLKSARARLKRLSKDMICLSVDVPIDSNSPVPKLVTLPKQVSSRALAYRSQLSK